MDDTISRQMAIDAVSDACFELRGVFWRCEDALKALPSAQPEQHLTCKNCIHLGHAYMMPCKNCKRNQMLPDWYEVETERREDE